MKKKGNSAAIRLVAITNTLVNTVVLIILALLITVSFLAIWDSQQVFEEAKSTQYAIYKPTPKDNTSFEDLKKINPEVFSWLNVYGTNIDYPLVQGKDNMKYVNMNAKGIYSLSGSLFLDYRNAQDFSDFNSIIYGHHMEKEVMFGQLELFRDENYFQAHPYASIYVDGKNKGLEFFLFLHADAYDTFLFNANIQGDKAQEEYLKYLYANAINTKDIEIGIKDKLILLTTCSTDSTNGRDILVGVLREEAFENTFIEKDDDLTASKEDTLQKYMGYIVFVFLFILGILFYVLKKRRKIGGN